MSPISESINLLIIVTSHVGGHLTSHVGGHLRSGLCRIQFLFSPLSRKGFVWMSSASLHLPLFLSQSLPCHSCCTLPVGSSLHDNCTGLATSPSDLSTSPSSLATCCNGLAKL